jgi:hypothetical protein
MQNNLVVIERGCTFAKGKIDKRMNISKWMLVAVVTVSIEPVLAATCMGINLVNWRTDATPAILHDTITVTLAPEYHVLVVSGYSGSEYAAYKNFINVGDIHSCEPWLYSECLAKNIRVRANAWRMKQAQ